MRIHFERARGFAGIRLSGSIDADALPPEEAKSWQALVEKAQLGQIPSIVRSGWQDQGLFRILAYGRRRREAVLRTYDRRNLTALGNASDRSAAGFGEETKALFLNSNYGRRGVEDIGFTVPEYACSALQERVWSTVVLGSTIGCAGLPTQLSRSVTIVPTCRDSAQSRAFSASGARRVQHFRLTTFQSTTRTHTANDVSPRRA